MIIKNTIMNFINVILNMLQNFFLKINNYIAFGTIVIICLPIVIPGIDIKFTQLALFPLLIILTTAIFEIRKNIVSDSNCIKSYDNCTVASPEIMQEIIKYTRNPKQEAKIRVLGGALDKYWVTLEDTFIKLLEQSQTAKLIVEIAMTDPNCNSRGADKQHLARLKLEQIRSFLQSNDKVLSDRGWVISVAGYEHVPQLHGFLIGEDILFAGMMTSDTEGTITGTHSLIERYDRNDKNNGSIKICQFLDWHKNSSKNPLI